MAQYSFIHSLFWNYEILSQICNIKHLFRKQIGSISLQTGVMGYFKVSQSLALQHSICSCMVVL